MDFMLDNLYIIPPTRGNRFKPEALGLAPADVKEALYLSAYRTLGSTQDRVEQLNDCLNEFWPTPVAQPIRFTNDKQYARSIPDPTAPAEMWICLDLSNGDPREYDGHLYVWAFRTKDEALNYRRSVRVKIAEGVEMANVSAPIQIYQR